MALVHKKAHQARYRTKCAGPCAQQQWTPSQHGARHGPACMSENVAIGHRGVGGGGLGSWQGMMMYSLTAIPTAASMHYQASRKAAIDPHHMRHGNGLPVSTVRIMVLHVYVIGEVRGKCASEGDSNWQDHNKGGLLNMMPNSYILLLPLLLNWVRATPDRPFMSSKSSSQTRLIRHTYIIYIHPCRLQRRQLLQELPCCYLSLNRDLSTADNRNSGCAEMFTYQHTCRSPI